MKIEYAGVVQGVGFRYTVQRLACEHRIVGWVRNNRDGTVSALAEGTADQIEDFRVSVRESGVGRIDGEQETAGVATGEFQSFETIR